MWKVNNNSDGGNDNSTSPQNFAIEETIQNNRYKFDTRE